jgi:hypothetical protein
VCLQSYAPSADAVQILLEGRQTQQEIKTTVNSMASKISEVFLSFSNLTVIQDIKQNGEFVISK